MDGQAGERTDGQTGRKTDRWIGGHTDGRVDTLELYSSYATKKKKAEKNIILLCFFHN